MKSNRENKKTQNQLSKISFGQTLKIKSFIELKWIKCDYMHIQFKILFVYWLHTPISH